MTIGFAADSTHSETVGTARLGEDTRSTSCLASSSLKACRSMRPVLDEEAYRCSACLRSRTCMYQSQNASEPRPCDAQA
jgi:hypothetical protein